MVIILMGANYYNVIKISLCCIHACISRRSSDWEVDSEVRNEAVGTKELKTVGLATSSRHDQERAKATDRPISPLKDK